MKATNKAFCALAAGAAMLSYPIAASADGYKAEILVPGSAFHGVHGLAVGADGSIYAGSVAGAALYKVDPKTGEAATEIPALKGMADDIAIAPDGTMAWTAFLMGDIYSRKGDGPIKKLASGLPGVNSLAYRKDGRLYATQVFLGDALYEIDTAGEKEPRKIMEKMGGLNGFQFGPDDKIYGPLWFKGKVVKVDVDKAEIETVADGFKIPAAVNLDSKGNIWAVDTAAGQLVEIDAKTGEKKVAAQLETSLDNLAISDDDRIFVSNMADNGIQEVDPKTGDVRQIIKGKLAYPGGIAIVDDGGKETIYVADLFAYRSVDAASGEVSDIGRMHAAGGHLEYPFNATANGEHVVLSSWFTSTVQVMDRKSGHSLKMLHGFKAPQDAIELPDGTLLVAELGTGSLLKVTGEDGKERTAIAAELGGPVGMVMDGADAVYVTESIAGQVTRITLADGAKKVIAKDLKLPEGIALRDGKLIVAEVGKKRLVSIDPANGAVTELIGDLPVGREGAPNTPPSNVPTGVAVGKDGTIYMSSDVENAIYKITRQ